MEGIVFDVQRCSLRDGPGIRTTVFLKGCSLNCLWCHNPESISPKPELSFDAEMCVHCLACVAACPHGAQQASESQHVLARDLCRACGACVAECAYGALKMVGELMSVEAVLREVEKDSAYYHRSGGGITLSGGEPMVQFDFALALLRAAKARGIHTCVETNGFAPQARYEQTLPHVDLFLFDYKATDPERHQTLTGVTNEMILANLDFLYRRGASIVLRCPLVPGINDARPHLAGIAALASRYQNLAGIEIMPYHEMGREKGRRVGRKPALPNLKTTSEETKASWLETLRDLGCARAQIS